MTGTSKPLTFNEVDGLGFAAASGRLDLSHLPGQYSPHSLGPLMEFLHLVDSGRLPGQMAANFLVANGAVPLITALRDRRERWMSPESRRMGFIRAVRKGPDGANRLTAFLMDAQRAAEQISGLPGTTPGQMAGAMQELENNIHEHSGNPDTGVLAFRAARGTFEFVVADAGVGILSSLRSCPLYAVLEDHGKALQVALSDGASRFAGVRRGHGFRPIFLGLANLYGSLRFRSGDHALVMVGPSPTQDLATAQLVQKPLIDGFFASIRCGVSH